MILFARVNPDTPGKLAMHAYSYEHMELAAYELLGRVAERVGDDETVQLAKTIRDQEFPDSCLTEDANLLIMPNVDAANITYNALRVTAGGGITVGGILLGAAKPVHIMTPSSTVRRIVNMTAVAVADAGAHRTRSWALD